jgi:branched-chain amino acid transport system substrate-binding protein
MKKRYLLAGLFALVLAVALFAVACGGGGEETTTSEAATTTITYPIGTSTGTIKVGHIFDQTGNEATVGSVFQESMQYAFLNASVGGREVQLIEADGKSTTEGAVEAARKLVEQDGVSVIMGPTQIGQKTAVASYCAEKQVPMVLYNPTPAGTLEENEWVIGVGGLSNQFGTAVADYMYNDKGYRTMSVLGPEDSSGHAFFTPVIEYFTALGGEVVQEQWATGQTDDWSAYMATVEDVDVLCAWVGGSGQNMLTAYYDTGLKNRIPIVGAFSGGSYDPWVFKNMGEANRAMAESFVGTVAVSSWDMMSTSPENVAFKEGKAKFGAWGKPLDSGFSGATQGGMVVLKALESCASNLSNVALRDAILAVDMVGPEGRVFFAPGENIATKPMYIYEVALQPAEWNPEDSRALFYTKTIKTYEAVPPHGLAQK